MPGAFEASPEFDHDELRTAEEIQRCGAEVLAWLEAIATSSRPRAVDPALIDDIHRRWFETTFPPDAGRHRRAMVLNRKATAVPYEAILPAIANACENWAWRRENAGPADPVDFVEFVVAEANTLTVTVYDVHPFIDGNTRATWHLRNYLLMVDGLRPLVALRDESAYLDAWWAATPHDHEALDDIVLRELAWQER